VEHKGECFSCANMEHRKWDCSENKEAMKTKREQMASDRNNKDVAAAYYTEQATSSSARPETIAVIDMAVNSVATMSVVKELEHFASVAKGIPQVRGVSGARVTAASGTVESK
jgi:hypothetical protein